MTSGHPPVFDTGSQQNNRNPIWGTTVQEKNAAGSGQPKGVGGAKSCNPRTEPLLWYRFAERTSIGRGRLAHMSQLAHPVKLFLFGFGLLGADAFVLALVDELDFLEIFKRLGQVVSRPFQLGFEILD